MSADKQYFTPQPLYTVHFVLPHTREGEHFVGEVAVFITPPTLIEGELIGVELVENLMQCLPDRYHGLYTYQPRGMELIRVEFGVQRRPYTSTLTPEIHEVLCWHVRRAWGHDLKTAIRIP